MVTNNLDGNNVRLMFTKVTMTRVMMLVVTVIVIIMMTITLKVKNPIKKLRGVIHQKMRYVVFSISWESSRTFLMFVYSDS